MITYDPFRCICPLDPADLVNGYPRAVEGYPAHRARYAAQRLVQQADLMETYPGSGIYE